MSETAIGAERRKGLGRSTTMTHPERKVLRGAWRFTLIKNTVGTSDGAEWLVVDLDMGAVLAVYGRKRDADHHVDVLEYGEHDDPTCNLCEDVAAKTAALRELEALTGDA